MPVDISSLIKDPEFRSLAPDQKRELLAEGDPEFSSLSNQEIEDFSRPSELAIEETPLAQMVAQGYKPTRQELQQVAAERLVAQERGIGFRPNDLILKSEAEQLASEAGIPTGQLGEVMSTSQFEPSLRGKILESLVGARQAASAAGLGVPGAVGRGIESLVLNPAQQRILGSQSLRERAPVAENLGTAIGGIVPTRLVGGAALSVGAPVLQKVRQGSQIGGLVGGTAAGATTLEEAGTPKEIIVNTLLGTGAGLAIGGAIPVAGNIAASTLEATGKGLKKIISPIKALEDSGVFKTNEAVAIDIINPSGEGEIRQAADDILSGRTIGGFQNIKKTAAFNDLPTLISSADKTLPRLGKEIRDFSKENPGIKIDASDASDAMVASVNRDPILVRRNPEVVDLVKRNADALRKDLSLEEAFDEINSINARHKNYHTATAKGQATKEMDAEFETDEIARRYLSSKVNDAIEGVSGVERNPFREYGVVNNILQQTQKRYAKAFVDRLNEISDKSLVADVIKDFDITKPLAALGKKFDFLRGGELGRLNRRAESLNKGLPTKKAPRVLTEAERTAKLKGKLAVPPLLPEAQAQDALNAKIAQSQADFQKALQFQRETGGVAFGPTPEDIQQTQALEDLFRQSIERQRLMNLD